MVTGLLSMTPRRVDVFDASGAVLKWNGNVFRDPPFNTYAYNKVCVVTWCDKQIYYFLYSMETGSL